MTTKQAKPEFQTTFVTPVFRLSYPNIWQSKYNQLAKRDQYDIQMLFPKAEVQMTPLITSNTGRIPVLSMGGMVDLMNKLTIWKWGSKPVDFVNPFKDGNTKKDSAGVLWTEKNPAYKDMIIVGSWSKTPPGVMDTTGKHPIIEHTEIYGGCYCRANLNAYAYEQGKNRGVSFGLLHIQKVKDGDPFGNRTRPEDAFAPVAGAESQAEQTQSVDSMFS